MANKHDMPEGLVALFEDLMLRNEYEEAIDFLSDCDDFIPTSYVISEVIFKIMMTSDSGLSFKAMDHLELTFQYWPTDDNHKYILIEGLKSKTGSFGDVWDAFQHFVLSSLHHRKILDDFVSLQEYVKDPNCDHLVYIYVKAFLKSQFKSTVFESHPEEKFSALVKWINVLYKYNVVDELLEWLHSLLDFIFELELSNDPAIPKCVAIQKASVSNYFLILMNGCKDVFNLENQQKFFILADSPYLVLKICKQRLEDMLEKESSTKNSELTLKSIVEGYFFDQHTEKSPKQEPKEARKFSKKARKKNKPSTSVKDPLFANLKPDRKLKGDTDFHIYCRSDKCDSLLEALYGDKNKDINVKNSLGMTPLHEACLVGSFLCCKFLIEDSGVRKVDYRAVDNNGRTSLHFAVYKKALDIVKLLIKNGGSDLVKCRDNMGRKPIDYCESEKIRKVLQGTESQLESSDDGSKLSSVSVPRKLPTLKNPEDLPLYVQTLRSLIGHYCEIYDIPKNKEAKLLSHYDEECYHYKASAEKTSCMEDFSALETIVEDIKELSACIKNTSTDMDVTKLIRGLNILALGRF